MDEFYSEMQQMAKELLAPTSEDGLGQGHIELARTVTFTPDEDKPWETETDVDKETLKGAVKGISKELVGSEVGSAVIVATDLEVTAAVPDRMYEPGDTLLIDGKTVQVLKFQKIPAAGTPAAVKFIVRA